MLKQNKMSFCIANNSYTFGCNSNYGSIRVMTPDRFAIAAPFQSTTQLGSIIVPPPRIYSYGIYTGGELGLPNGFNYPRYGSQYYA